jgi:putative addiction module component (TIGR02574 family)
MNDTLRELQEKVLTLPSDERAVLAELLLASLEPKSSAQRAWAELASRRRADVIVGKTSMVPGAQALARIRAKLA